MDFKDRALLYKKYRKQDYRLTERIEELLSLEKGRVIADLGAGTGNYSSALREKGYKVFSVEPEKKMREQCTDNQIKWIDSCAENINLPGETADGVIIINAIHHFFNVRKGLEEAYRILRDGYLLIFTFDPVVAKQLWLFDYWPELKEYEDRNYQETEQLKKDMESVFQREVEEIVFEIPFDFQDIFSAATWRRPQILLDKEARSAMSLFNSVDTEEMERGVCALRRDLESGRWEEKYADLIRKESLDAGCRILRVRK